MSCPLCRDQLVIAAAKYTMNIPFPSRVAVRSAAVTERTVTALRRPRRRIFRPSPPEHPRQKRRTGLSQVTDVPFALTRESSGP